MNNFLDSDSLDNAPDGGTPPSLPELSKNRGGRPPQINVGQLLNRRDRFIDVLSATWGDVGWELREAVNQEDVRKAFESLAIALRGHEYLIAHFLLPVAVEVAAPEIQATKAQSGKKVKRIYKLQPIVESAERRARESGSALTLASDNQRLPLLLDIHFERFAAYMESTSEMDQVNKDLKNLERKVAEQEACYAQAEALNFISRGKYAHTPRNLAQAIAGLPEIGCWYSFQQCEKSPSPLWPMHPDEIPSWTYRSFLIIEECCKQSYLTKGKTLEAILRERLRAIPSTSDLQSLLRPNWRYLRQVVEQTDLTKIKSEEAPYRIFAAFLKNVPVSRSFEELALADREQRDL